MRILIIEDNLKLAKIIKNQLKGYYKVELASNASQAENLLNYNKYELILIDIKLPDKNGIKLCKEIKQAYSDTSIIMLTGIHDVEYKIKAFEAGADDYVTKPVNIEELRARMVAVVRRNHNVATPVIQAQDLKLDLLKKQAEVKHKKIALRKKEFEILEILLLNKGTVLTRDQLLNYVWDDSSEIKSNTVDVHIKSIRSKVEKPHNLNLIKTVHGYGYKIEN